MGRWSDMDSDAERLPSGFERIGYDADTQTYTFRDTDGNLYESESGNRYGQLHPVGSHTSDSEEDPGDEHMLESGRKPSRTFGQILGASDDNAIKKDNREAVRMMLPFALLVFVFLLLLFKLLYRSEADDSSPQATHCGEGSHQVQIKQGDTCGGIAEERGVGVEELLALRGNEKLDCATLEIGTGVCVPDA